MKALIWVLSCILPYSIITTICRENGVLLGAIPTVILFFILSSIAGVLCKKWSTKKATEQPQPKDIPPAPATTGVYKVKRVERIPVKEQDNAPNKICFCRKCGEKLLEDSKFCRKCGTEVIDSENL